VQHGVKCCPGLRKTITPNSYPPRKFSGLAAYKTCLFLSTGFLAREVKRRDALRLRVYQAKEDDDFRSDDIKVLCNWPPPGWPE